MLRGIDVSHYQGLVNWSTLRAVYGLSWGAAKATEGTTYRDAQFPNNWNAMKSADLVRMAYHFARPDNDAANQANVFLSTVKAAGIGPTDIMVLDLESNPNNLPMLALSNWVNEWADRVTAETGRKPFLYTGSGYITNNGTVDVSKHFAAWWFPKYPSAYDGNTKWPTAITGYPTPNNWGSAPDIWQFSQSFAGKYDANIANMTLSDLQTRGTISIGVDMLDTTDKSFIDARMQAYSLWLDMRQRRIDLLVAQANNSPKPVIDLLQTEYTNAYNSWKSIQA